MEDRRIEGRREEEEEEKEGTRSRDGKNGVPEPQDSGEGVSGPWLRIEGQTVLSSSMAFCRAHFCPCPPP